MIITRKIKVANYVFTVADLNRFARILDEQAPLASKLKYETEYQVKFDDDHSIAGSAIEVFQEEEFNRTSRPRAIEMRLHCYPLDRSIRVELSAGDSDYGNAIVISGDDANWVNANHKSLENALEKVAPQSFWFTKHRFALWALLSVAITSLLYLIPKAFWGLTVKFSNAPGSELPTAIPDPFSHPAGLWFIGCGIIWAFPVWRWVLSAWPSIEFNFGKASLRPEHKRRRLTAVWTLVALPLLLEAVFKIVEKIFG
jgi:hypothetical protein